MTAFKNLKKKLADHGIEAMTTWQQKFDGGMIEGTRFVKNLKNEIRTLEAIVILNGPGYQLFIESKSININDDVSRILKAAQFSN